MKTSPSLRSTMRDAAGEATQGQWRHGNVEKYHVFVECTDAESVGHERVLLKMNTHFVYEPDAAHIASACPSNVTALLEDVETLRALLQSAIYIARRTGALSDSDEQDLAAIAKEGDL